MSGLSTFHVKFALVPVLLLLLPSCLVLRGKKHTYQQGTPVAVEGAEVSVSFRPEGTRSGAVMVDAMVVGGGRATFDGPFRWRVEAKGASGIHQKLAVYGIRTKTGTTGRDERFPRGELGRVANFRDVAGQPGVSRARYPIPGKLMVEPEKDGKLEVWMDLGLQVRGRWHRKTVHFLLDPAVKSQNEFLFLPSEIIQNVGKPVEEQSDSMWD